MTDYASMKVPELKKLLAEKKLAQTGNKADLIARLQEEDNKADATSEAAKPGTLAAEDVQGSRANATTAAETKEDEINYSDDEAAKPAAAEPAPAASTDAAAADPVPETAKDADVPAAEATPAEPAPSFAMGLDSSAVDEETRKRAERAKRFGIEEDNDAEKRADRAKRFGIDEKDLAKGLDSALPSRPLKRGRGQQDGNRPGKRHNHDRRDRRNGRTGGGGGGNAPVKKTTGIIDDPAEKAKAEKRAARFAAA
jgi:SAP domain-containing ribonucleoprotein